MNNDQYPGLPLLAEHKKSHVFYINSLKGTYDMSDFNIDNVENKCTTLDIQNVFNAIYNQTNHLLPIRRQAIIIVLSIAIFIIFIISVITVFIYNQFYRSLYIDTIVIISVISGISILYASFLLYYNKLSNVEIPNLRNKILDVISIYRSQFENLGLMWILSDDCKSIELRCSQRIFYSYPSPQFPYNYYAQKDPVTSPSFEPLSSEFRNSIMSGRVAFFLSDDENLNGYEASSNKSSNQSQIS